MAIVVVGGSGRNVGKTALVCGLIAAFTEFRWTAVKISTHDHGKPKPVWEATAAGTETDTARYLAAGAERALLVTAEGEELGPIVRRLMDAQGPATHLIFESNSILHHLQPDLCLAVDGGTDGAERKPSFSIVELRSHAKVMHSDLDGGGREDKGSKPVFHLVALEKISPEMLGWTRTMLHGGAR